MKHHSLIVPDVIEQRILLIRGRRVMLSVHLAELYGVETRALNQSVKRNANRFPEDFMFQLTVSEAVQLVSQNVIPHRKCSGNRFRMCSLTESCTPRGGLPLPVYKRGEE